MRSQDQGQCPLSNNNPFHSHLLPGLRELHQQSACQHRPPIPFQSEKSDLHSTLHAAFHLCLPDLDLIALEGPCCRQELQDDRSFSVIFIAQGEVCIEQKDTSWCGSPGDCLIVQGDKLHWSSTDFSIVCLMFPEHQHNLHIQQLQPGIQASHASISAARQPACCQARQGKDVASLIRSLHLLLCIISDLQTSCPLLLPHLKMGDQLGSITSMLASAELRQTATSIDTDRAPTKQHSVLDQLVDYIDSHLSESLSLNMLEVQSHYSRRTLQYAFRAEYGCTVTQWIRARRLDLAHRRLSLGAAGDNVGEIARACGYRSMSLFSIEFQQRFHIKPSVLLREARAHKAMVLARQATARSKEISNKAEPG